MDPGMLEAMNAVKKKARAKSFPIRGPKRRVMAGTPIPPVPRGSRRAAQSRFL
jgi:hypothetical protein